MNEDIYYILQEKLFEYTKTYLTNYKFAEYVLEKTNYTYVKYYIFIE
jgi:hypothetical protein